VQEPVYQSYLDAPQTAGTWTYSDDPGETLAAFFETGNDIEFVLRCDKATGMVRIGRFISSPDTANRLMRITTETSTRQLQARPVANAVLVAAAELDPRDPLLDAMALTKGRFAVEVEGERTLYLPAWAEVTRVIEDCR
jgi:hypothetical protein